MFGALQAGNAPDLGQIEYATLPGFEHVGGVVDLASLGAGSIDGTSSPWTWSQVTQGSDVFAIPRTLGPSAILPRRPVQGTG